MKFNKLIWIILLLSTASVNIPLAQININGNISDKNTNEPLPYVNIYIPHQDKGTYSNEEGEFEIMGSSKVNFQIQFSYVGYKTVIESFSVDSDLSALKIALEPTSLRAEEVVISGGTYSTQHENAIKIERLNINEITSSGTPSFIKSLSQIPGIDVIDKGPGVSKPVIRGLSMTNILMLNNGVKMENFQFSEHHPFIIDEFGVERVEVIKGPASLLYGSDAIGGVINVIKEKPALTGKITGDYNLQYHSNTEGIVTNLGLKGSSNSFFWGIRAGIKEHTDFKDGDTNNVPNSRFNEQSFKANVGVRKSYGLFRVYYDYNRPKLGMSVEDIESRVTSNGYKIKYWYQDLTNHIISTQNTLFTGKVKTDINASYQANNRKLQTDNSMPAYEMVDMDLKTVSYEVKTYLPNIDKSEYILGVQGAYKTNRNKEAPNHVVPDAEVSDISVFGLVKHTLFEKLRTQLGARYDIRIIETEAETGKASIDKQYDNISASIGATYELNNKLLIRSNLASAYRTPNLAELTQNGVHEERFEKGNSALNSQRSYETDLSIHFHSKHFIVDISGFYNNINDYIFLSPTAETTSTGYNIYAYEQTDSRLYGYEVSLNIIPYRKINFTTGYAYLIGEQTDGTHLPLIPHNKLRFDLKRSFKDISIFKNSYIKIGGVWAMDQNNVSGDEEATKGYFLLNSSIGTEISFFNQPINLSLHGNNLLNKTYVDHLSTLKEVRHNNMGRNISINLKIPFNMM